MVPIRIGLMGLGRIGRNLFRILYKRRDIEIVAISDIADHASLEYLLRFDTLLGRFPDPVRIVDGHLYAAGKQIPILANAGPSGINWKDLGVDYVVEATGRHRTREEFDQYLEGGARRVVLCAPPADRPDLTVVMGVNQDRLTAEHRIVSNASCTAHATAPILSILNEAFGIERAMFTSVHAYTNQDRLADVPSADPRRGRAAAENIIPQESKSAAALEELLPQLKGRISAMAMNVPVPDGSVVDLVCWHDRAVTVTAINEVVRTAAGANWKGMLEYEDEPIVSTDILCTGYSGTFDSKATMVLGDRVSKTLIWYDNGYGYAARVVDLLQHFASLDRKVA
jgi:glyceraldehyde 3-phosphate dehydrogenase